MPEKPTYEELERRILEIESPAHYRNKSEILEFSSQFEKHDAVILVIDPDSGTIINANMAAQNFYGYSINILKQMRIQEINTLSPDEIAEKRQQAAEEKCNYFEFPHRLSSGEIRTVRVHSSPVVLNGKKRLLSIIHDITECKLVEKALRESEEKYRTLVETLPYGVEEVDLEGRKVFLNDAYHHLLGYEPETLTGTYIWDLDPTPEEAERTRAYFQHLKKEQPPPEPYLGKNMKRDGTIIDVLVDWNYKRGPTEGDLQGFISVVTDITLRKRYEQELHEKTVALETALKELRRTQRHFTEQERHRALSRMAGGIAHDFNNSLSTILGFSDLLLQAPDKLTDIQNVHRYLSLINTAAHDAAQIVRRLRKFYRPSDDERIEPLDLNALVKEALDLTEPVWKHDARARGAPIRVETNFCTSARIAGNRAELHETITNLIFNAVDAMPEGGEIRLCTCRENPWIVLEIGDTGIGMDENVRRQCLDPFFTTKGEAGSGLGLATARGIITRHQGELDIHSQPGQGTTFFLRLPAGIEEKTGENPEKPTGTEQKSLKILLIDDEKTQLEVLKEFLQQANHQVETAADGLEGMEKFPGGGYDLIITDRAMPEMSEDALAQHIKRIAPDKPVIMLTGFGDMMAAAGETTAAVDLVLTKPVSLKKLRQAIETLLTG